MVEMCENSRKNALAYNRPEVIKPISNKCKAGFPLAKVSAITLATATVTSYLPWPPWAM